MHQLLKQLEQNNIAVFLEKGELRVSYEGDSLSTDLLEKIKDHKSKLISFLNKYSRTESYQEIPEAPISLDYPLSSSQYRIWMLCSSDEVSTTYNVPNYIHITGSHNTSLLEQAIHSTINRHESLRTVFRLNENGELRQYVLSTEELDFSVNYIDYSEQQEPEASVRACIAEDTDKVFDLENGPLVRIWIFKLTEENYVLHSNIHHIISDTWSLDILFRDILAYYRSYKDNSKLELSPLRIQYKDYAVWQTQNIDRQKELKQEQFWVDKFSGELPVLDLPSYRGRPKFKTYNGTSLETYISAEDTQLFKAYCQEKGLSLYMGLLAVWNVLFYKYTGQRDITIGTAIAGRDHLDLKDQIGCFINTLALRNTIDPELSFSNFCEQLKIDTLQAYEHQEYPFDKLIKKLSLKRDLSRGVLFDVMFLLQNAVDNIVDIQLTSEQVDQVKSNGSKGAITDLDITIREEGNYLRLDTVFNSDIYDQQTIISLMKHFKQLLHHFLEDDQQPIKTTTYLSNIEKKNLIYGFNDTYENYPQDITALDLLAKQVKSNPDAIVAIFEDNPLTYKELDLYSNQLARLLLKKGVGLEKLVPIYLDRSWDMLVAMFGIMKAGGAFVPIDPEYPKERVAFILEDTKADVVITHSHLKNKLSQQSVKTVIAIDTQKYLQEDTKAVSVEIQPSNLVYVIYTSGTTGKPKGVLIEHRGLCNLVTNQIEYLEVTQESIAIQFASIGFDASCYEIFICLFAGGRLIIPSKETLLDVEQMKTLFRTHKINMATLPPSYLTVIEDVVKNVKTVVSAGESLNTSIARKLQRQGVRIVNAYGPTENTVCATETDQPFQQHDIVTIGKPIKNTQAYIVDEFLQIVPPGVIGELCISGDQVARGYLNRNELTKEKFVNHPFLSNGSKLYRTGDLARWLPDGNIEFIGRKDDQVKIKGYRIELKEIQNTLLEQKGIQQAAVLVKEHLKEKLIVAYVVGENIDISDLRSELSKALPVYMVPSHFMEINEMPLTSNGKIDKKTLLKLDLSKNVINDYLAPKTEIEKTLIDISQEVLFVERIGLKDNFYAIGGDSIKAIQLIAKCKQKGYNVKAKDILGAKDFEELAGHLQKGVNQIVQKEIVGEVSLTPIQHFFFTTPSFKIHNHFNQSVVLKSNIPLTSQAIEACFDRLIMHHDALRMTFSKEANNWSQYNQDATRNSYTLQSYDLKEEQSPLKVMGSIAEELQSGLDISVGPLVSIGHFRLNDGDRLAIIVHHLVMDGVSWRILLEDLSTLFEQYQKEISLQLPLKTNGYKEWSLMLHTYAKSDVMDKEQNYWKNQCNYQKEKLPLDYEVEEKTWEFDAEVSFELDQETSETLKSKIHGALQTDMNDVLLTALAIAIQQTLGVNQTSIRLEGHGREEIGDGIDVSRTVGWFTSVYPFLLTSNIETNSLEVLKNIKNDLREIPNKGIGYGILKYLTPNTIDDINADVEFNYLGDFGSKVGSEEQGIFEYCSDYIGSSNSKENKNDVPLSVLGMLSSGTFKLSIRFSKLLFKEETIQKLSSIYEQTLRKLIQALSSLDTIPVKIGDLVKISQNQKCFLPMKQSHGVLPAINIRNYSKETFENRFRQFLVQYPLLTVQLEQVEGNIYQRIVDPNEQKLSIVVKDENQNVAVTSLEKEALEYFQKPYDLYNSEIMRLFLIEQKEEKAILFLSIHHAVTDMVTNQLLSRKLQAYFDGVQETKNDVSGFRYIKWQEEFLASKVAQNHLDFWKESLQQLSMPIKEQSVSSSVACVTFKKVIKDDFFNKLKRQAEDWGVPLNAMFLAFHQSVCAQISTKIDGIQLVITNGREQEIEGVQIDNLLGVMSNFLPLKIQKPNLKLTKEYIIELFSTYLEAREHQCIPYATIQEEIQKENKVHGEFPIQGIFNFQSMSFAYTNQNDKEGTQISHNTNDYTKGVDLTCVVFSNAMEITLTVYQDMLSNNSFSLDSFFEETFQLSEEPVFV